MALTRPSDIKPKKGAYRKGRTEQYDGTKWNKVNVVHAGQKATLNGKPVVADGKGNWRIPAPNSISGYGKKVGTYKTSNRTSKTTTPSKRSTMGQAGVIEGDSKGATKAQQERSAAIKRTAAVKARAAAKAAAAKNPPTKAPPAPKLPPKPTVSKTPSKPTSKKSSASTYRDKKDTKGTSVGRYRTLKEHQDAVKAQKLLKGGKNIGPATHGRSYAKALKIKKKK